MNKDTIKKLCRDYQDGNLKVGPFTDLLEAEGVTADIAFLISDMHREISYLTNIHKLNAEEQVIAAKWRKEHELRRKAIHKMSDIKEDPVAHKAALEEYLAIGNERMCEHERSIWSNCGSCIHIEKTLYSSMFSEDENEDDE